MDFAMENKIVKNSLKVKNSKMLKQTMIFKRTIMNCLVAMVFLVSIAGCKPTQKEVKPDRYEKWRVLAEESRGNTPDPRQYDIELEEDEKALRIEEEDLKKEKADTPVKMLPGMPVDQI